MLEHVLTNRRIEKNQCNMISAKTEMKHAVVMNSWIEIWDGNQMLRSHNNLHLKWHTRSNMSVQRRNGHQTWILTWLCPRFYTPLSDSDILEALTQPKSENEGQSHENEHKQSS